MSDDHNDLHYYDDERGGVTVGRVLAYQRTPVLCDVCERPIDDDVPCYPCEPDCTRAPGEDCDCDNTTHHDCCWECADDVTCPLCVQWRCIRCKSDDWPMCCDWDTDSEPYWPDGTLAVLTQDEWCEDCLEAVSSMLDSP